jgi:hypothetical protein
MTTSDIKFPHLSVRLIGEDGNAFAIMGRVADALRRDGQSQEVIDAYMADSMSGDYNHLLLTAMRWVNCDGVSVTMKTNNYTDFHTTDYWDDVEEFLQDARLIAWDGCHKMYLAMDDEQAEWFRANYNGEECGDMTMTGTADEMLATLHQWWDESCGLRFIQAVSTNEENPNDGYIALIPQGAEEDYTCDSCGGFGETYADGMCESCWESAEEDEESEEDE